VLTVLRIAHVLSASVWVGGTAALVFAGVPAIRRLEGEPRAIAMRTLGRRWRPLGWGAMAVAVLSGLWLTHLHGGLNGEDVDSGFDRALLVKSALVVLLVAAALVHDFRLGPQLQGELRAGSPRAPATRRRLVVVGWVSFAATVAVPILGVVVLGYVD
jgi:putative copper export protein